MDILDETDPEVAMLIDSEENRINDTLDLIAAENLTPRSVMEAQGSIFTIKAAEGYPGHRFHAGCVHADQLERLAVDRGKTLFGAEHVNVQPHSGSSANISVYFSVLNPGDRVLSMGLSHGGHLSHGHRASLTSKCFDFAHYGLHQDTERIDYDAVRDIALSCRPKMIVAGASSYPRLIDYEILSEIAKDISAYLLTDMAHIAGLVAARVIPSPVPFSDFVTFTTYKTLMGGRGGVILCRRQHGAAVDRAVFPGGQGTPSLNHVAAKAVCFKIAARPEFIRYQSRVLENAHCLARSFDQRGYRIVSGGTDNHLVLIDLGETVISGSAAEKVLESVGIIVNRNVIPRDSEKPETPGGIRIGSPAVTARGMGENEIETIVDLMDTTLRHPDQPDVLNRVSQSVTQLCRKFPAYGLRNPANKQ